MKPSNSGNIHTIVQTLSEYSSKSQRTWHTYCCGSYLLETINCSRNQWYRAWIAEWLPWFLSWNKSCIQTMQASGGESAGIEPTEQPERLPRHPSTMQRKSKSWKVSQPCYWLLACYVPLSRSSLKNTIPSLRVLSYQEIRTKNRYALYKLLVIKPPN